MMDEEEGDEVEEVTFLEVKKGGEILVLLDGRKLWVNPGDMSYVLCWSPTAALEITKGDDVFSLNVRNTVNDDVVRAKWM
jgi:hypothetical protein